MKRANGNRHSIPGTGPTILGIDFGDIKPRAEYHLSRNPAMRGHNHRFRRGS
jgi:hypothetical protein